MPSLTMPEAQARAALLAVDSYQLDIDLTSGPETFCSTTTIRFTCAAPGADSFVETRPRRLVSASLNGADLGLSTSSGGRVRLPGLRDANLLVVEAEFPYSHASEGMHRFADPADGQVYVYAQPSIAQAPGFMACFDQPDLKAPVTLRVRADPGWTVRANGPGTMTGPGRWAFAPTKPLASYLVTMAAGPYHEVRAEHDGIPLGLFARASLAEHLDREAPELLGITTSCLDRYHQLFGIRYPFGKYDQVFAPELSWGAMEFPGCVLIRDEHVFQSAVTGTQRESRAVLIAHEMAHMWFGNLVTMRWWDDLWLNESFADHLGWWVIAESTRWRDAWTSYGVSNKAWGYAADQRPSTHPVAAAGVADTAAALSNFDGISYAKGSAVLRQLVAWVGEEDFLAGLRVYFDAHAYGNATLADLLSAVSDASGRDLSGWSRVWLREPGVNTLRPEVSVDAEGRYAAAGVRQAGTGPHPVLRPHRITVGLYDRDGPGGTLVRRKRVPVDLDPARDGGRTAVPELVGRTAAALLLVNDCDLGYAKVRLAEGDDVVELLPKVADPLARSVLWVSAWDACRDGELPPGRFVALAVAALPGETELAVLETVLDQTVDTVVGRFLPPAARPEAYAAVAGVCREILDAAEPAGDRQLAAARGLVRCAGEGDLGWLAGWLDGVAVPRGLAIDADLRWLVMLRLAGLDAAGEATIAAERRRDPGARGEQEAIRCRAARPDPAAKERAWRLVSADREQSNRIVTAAAEGLWQPGQPDLTRRYVSRYFEEIGATAAWRGEQMLTAVTRAAYPSYSVEPATLAAARARLASDDLHPVVRREMADGTDDLRRALAARTAGVAGVAGAAGGERPAGVGVAGAPA